ncbi:MAG: hypothetical protein KF861_07770 [Planctomycetaceae bacterium]|nr:hypothetical protein [Planctomycetaceae bacterium]
MRSLGICVCLLVLLTACGTPNSQSAPDVADPPNDVPPGRVFDIYLDAGENTPSYLLEGMTEEVFLGMRCVKGTYANPHVAWLHGTVIRIPVDKITLIAEFPSLEDYLKRIETVGYPGI